MGERSGGVARIGDGIGLLPGGTALRLRLKFDGRMSAGCFRSRGIFVSPWERGGLALVSAK